MDSEDEDQEFGGFAKEGGEALNLGDDGNDFLDDDEDEDEDQEPDPVPQKRASPQKSGGHPAAEAGSPKEGDKIENKPYDEVVNVNDSGDEIDSEEEDEVNVVGTAPQPNKIPQGTKLAEVGIGASKKDDDDDEDEDEDGKGGRLPPGAYNPADYADMQVA